MSEQNTLIAERKKKLEQWKALGHGYAKKFDRTHTATQAIDFCKSSTLRNTPDVLKKPTMTAHMCGRIVLFRDMGKLVFLKIKDASGDFQVCMSQGILGDEYDTWKKLFDLGDFVGFSGEFFLTKHGEPTLMAASLTPLSKALRPLPEKFHGLSDTETSYRQRYLDLISNHDTFERFKTRTKVIQQIRKFFDEKEFYEVETPILQSQAGGAMARVFETHHNDFDHNFVLRIALELPHKMIMAGGFERIYEIGKNFRNEGSDPSHVQEFTMLEWYAAYVDLTQNMDWTETMIKDIMQKVLDKTTLTVFNKDDKPVEVDFAGTWPRVRFPDLIQKNAGIDMTTATEDEIRDKAIELGLDTKEAQKTGKGNLLDFIFKKSSRLHIIEPTFVMDYPSELKPLARPNGDGTAECYQLVVAGWEIVNSYGELIDPTVQRKLLEDQAAAKSAGDDEAMEVDEVFLTAMEHGMPPMTGFGMGIDRFVTLLTEQKNLRDTIFFPLMKPESK